MLHVIYGTDFKTMRKKLHSLQDALEKKRPEAEFFTLDDERFSAAHLKEFIESRGLFENKYIVTLDRCFLDEDAREEILERIEDIAESPHAFILVEGELDASDLKRIKKYAERIWEFERDTGKSKEDEYKIFSLTDAFGARDKRGVWVEYQRALLAGEAPAAIHGMLFWQTKNMIVAQETGSADEANMSSYPYKKAREFSQNFSRDDLHDISAELVDIYHRARRGEFELKERLEEFLLAL